MNKGYPQKLFPDDSQGKKIRVQIWNEYESGGNWLNTEIWGTVETVRIMVEVPGGWEHQEFPVLRTRNGQFLVFREGWPE